METTYHGRPCKRCGGTLRYTRSCACMACQCNKPTETKPPTETYNGTPCKKCGETLRYARDRNCVACTRERNRIKGEKRKARNANIPKRKPGSDRCLSCGKTKPYFFRDYCRECVAAEKTRVPEQHKTFTRCDNCGEWKPYKFTGFCRQCEALEKRRREYWAAQDKIKELEEQQRRYSDPF